MEISYNVVASFFLTPLGACQALAQFAIDDECREAICQTSAVDMLVQVLPGSYPIVTNAVQLNHFMPSSLAYSVAPFLKRQSDTYPRC